MLQTIIFKGKRGVSIVVGVDYIFFYIILKLYLWVEWFSSDLKSAIVRKKQDSVQVWIHININEA